MSAPLPRAQSLDQPVAKLPAPTGPPPIIVATELAKSYGVVRGLTNVNLQFAPGITGLLGPNGAGKSTLLKLLVGLLRPSLGSLKVLGLNPTKEVELYSRVGYVPEHDCFTLHYTGLEFVWYYLRLQGIPKAQARARAEVLLDRLQMDESVAARKLTTYSRGMRQKVKLARALGHDPELLVLDEPFQGADPYTRRLMMENIRNWAERGKSVVISSHILQDIEALTNTIVLINKGQVLAYGHRRAIRQMIEHIPQRVVVTPRDPSLVRKLSHALLDLPSVYRLDLVGHPQQPKNPPRVEVHTFYAGQFYRELPPLLVQEHIPVHEVVTPDDNLETLYNYLVGGRQWSQ